MIESWSTGGYVQGMLLVVTEKHQRRVGPDAPLGLCMAVAHGGDAFWYFAPVTQDGARYTPRLDERFCGYAWADKNSVQPDQRQRYLLLAGETVEIGDAAKAEAGR